MTPKKLEKLWQDYAMQESGEKRETLDEYFKSYGEVWELDMFFQDMLCLEDDIKNEYSIYNSSLTEYYYYIRASRSHDFDGKTYWVELGSIDLKSGTTAEILSDFINEMESIKLN